jgi:hypothetical protein
MCILYEYSQISYFTKQIVKEFNFHAILYAPRYLVKFLFQAKK